MDLRFLHLNIEGRRHLERIGAFLETNNFDVLCIQELCSDSAQVFKEKYGFIYQAFAQMGYWAMDKSTRNIAIMSKHPIYDSQIIALPKADVEYRRRSKTDLNFFLLKANIFANNVKFCFFTTHMPLYFDEDGKKNGWIISEYQVKCLSMIKEKLIETDEFLLTGDFNAPRGTFIFDDLALSYKDNVPNNISSTIDPVLHRAPHLQLVVDGVFTTKKYMVSNVKLHEGISDHKGISGTLTII